MTTSITTYSKKIVLTFVIIFHAALLFATDQIPDLIICSGSTLYISHTFDEEFPLYPLLQDETYNSKMEKYDNQVLKLSACSSTGFYRGYQAIWELHNGTVYLREVLDCCTKEPLFDLKKIFGEKNVKEKGVRAFWLNGPLLISSKPFGLSSLLEEIKTVVLHLVKGQVPKKK
ncbi:MAG: Unknown protein [uncultured Aureispira sp.]|uniref:Uncharacterized protein n=1 Tax=uncultured Aureispira sp. TaxID=1331704 RepID=A0A6S6SCG7_9BACT|nr:MAG: Unknown protein [uncultured Aureispira sp.]